MSGNEEDISTKLNIVFAAARQAGACQGHLLNEDREAVAGGGEVELQVALEGLAGPEEAGVEGEDGDDLLLDIEPGLAAVGGTNFVQPEQKTWRYVLPAPP